MYTEISQFEPLFPSESGELEDLAYRLVETSSQLEGRLSPETLSGIAELLRIVNSYYSNLIEDTTRARLILRERCGANIRRMRINAIYKLKAGFT